MSLYLCVEMLVMPQQETPDQNDVIILCSDLPSPPTNLFKYLSPPPLPVPPPKCKMCAVGRFHTLNVFVLLCPGEVK